MKRVSCTGTLIAVAIAGYSGAAVGQQGCESEIEQLRMQNQERQAGEQQVRQVSQMLDRAEDAGPGDCQRLVTQARQQLQQSGQGTRVVGTQQEGQTGQQTETRQERAPTLEQQQQQQAQEGEQAWQQPQQQQQQAQQREQGRQQPQQQQQAQQQAGQQGQAAEQMDVQVQQAPAEVQVQQGAPRVIVRQQPPKVTVEEQPPIVEIVQPEAEVNISQAEPQVTVNQSEAEVEVHQAEEPDIQVQQAGEPIVRMAGSGSEQDTETAQSRQQTGQRQEAAGSEWVGVREASQIVGASAVSRNGEEIGEISEVVRSRSDNELHAVVDAGGFLGIGERTVAIPLSEGEIEANGNLRVPYGSDQLEQMEEYDEQQYEEVQ